MNTKLIFLDQIDFAKSPRVRASSPNPEVVEQYARAYNEKKDIPPIIIFHDPSLKISYIADGLHRCAAITLLKRRAIMATVHEGPFNEALRYALLANSMHGLPRSSADKRQCVHQALTQWPDVSNSQIASMTDVDDKTVAVVREEMEAANKIKPTLKRKAADGRNLPSKAPRKSGVPKAKPRETEEEPPRIVVHELAKDELGVIIPIKVLPFWNRSGEVEELMDKISRIIGYLKAASVACDIMYGEVPIDGTIADLERAYVAVRTALPYAVCTTCQGHPETQKQGCRLCLGRGLISKFRYDALVPEEIRAIAKKKGSK